MRIKSRVGVMGPDLSPFCLERDWTVVFGKEPLGSLKLARKLTGSGKGSKDIPHLCIKGFREERCENNCGKGGRQGYYTDKGVI